MSADTEIVHFEPCGCTSDEATGLPIEPCERHTSRLPDEVSFTCRRDGCGVEFRVVADRADGDDGYCSNECAALHSENYPLSRGDA